VDILKGHLDAIGRDGLTVSGVKDMSVPFPAGRLLLSIDELTGRDLDALFVSLKAPVMSKVLPTLKKVVGPGTALVSLQNGLDTESPLADAFGRENTFRVVVNYAGNLVGDGCIKMNFFNPPNYLGGLEEGSAERGRHLARAIDASGLTTEYSDDIRHHEWDKLILNLALAALCALTGKTMKEMMQFQPTRELVRELMREGVEVASADGYDFGEGYLDRCMDWVDRTGYHLPSMAVDVREGRATEIAHLNGKVVEHGRRAGIPTPYNQALTALVMGRERPDDIPEEER
jgi:2-dehydropantoate 2-reductase